MPAHNYKILNQNTLQWVWKARPHMYTRLLLHRVTACHIEGAPKPVFSKALEINLLGFQTLLIDHIIGVVQLTKEAFIVPTNIILGRGGSSILKVALLFEKTSDGQSIRRVAFRIPYFSEKQKSGYHPGAYKANETQKSLYDHPNIEQEALFIGELEDPNIPYPLEFTVEEIWEQSYSYVLRDNTQRQGIDALEIVLSITKALDYLHSFNLIHRDIKPWNVLVKRNNTGHLDVQVTDVETIRPATDRKIPMRGTSGFIAPEVEASIEKIDNIPQGIQSIEGDLYALGQTILYYRFVLLQKAFQRAGSYPERTNDMAHIKMRTTVDRRTLSAKSFKQLIARLEDHNAFDGYPHLKLILTTLEDTARKLIHTDPKKRPSAHEIVELFESLQEVTKFK